MAHLSVYCLTKFLQKKENFFSFVLIYSIKIKSSLTIIFFWKELWYTGRKYQETTWLCWTKQRIACTEKFGSFYHVLENVIVVRGWHTIFFQMHSFLSGHQRDYMQISFRCRVTLSLSSFLKVNEGLGETNECEWEMFNVDKLLLRWNESEFHCKLIYTTWSIVSLV